MSKGNKRVVILLLLCGWMLGSEVLAQRPANRVENRRQRRDVAAQAQERRDEMIEFVRKHFPEKIQVLEELRLRNPERFRQKREELVLKVRRLMTLEAENQELFKVHVEELRLQDRLNRMAEQLRQMSAGKDKQEQELILRSTLLRSFELRQQIKEAELKELMDRLKVLEESLGRRQQRKEELIDSRYQELVKENLEDW